MATKNDRMERLEMILGVAMERPQSQWYKNCRNVRKRGGKICSSCPFRFLIEQREVRDGD